MTLYPPREEGGINVPGTIRKRLELYANLRPARSRPGVPNARPGLDVLIVRENTEGFYADRNMHLGIAEFMPTEDVALSVRKITRQGSRRIAKMAFEYADRRRKNVAAVGKQHVLQMTDGLFMSEAYALAKQNPDVAFREVDIDAMAADIYTRPQRYDVMLVDEYVRRYPVQRSGRAVRRPRTRCSIKRGRRACDRQCGTWVRARPGGSRHRESVRTDAIGSNVDGVARRASQQTGVHRCEPRDRSCA